MRDVEASQIGAYARYGPTVTSERPAPLRGGFAAGHDTRSILGELGYSADEVDTLIAGGVVAAAKAD